MHERLVFSKGGDEASLSRPTWPDKSCSGNVTREWPALPLASPPVLFYGQPPPSPQLRSAPAATAESLWGICLRTWVPPPGNITIPLRLQDLPLLQLVHLDTGAQCPWRHNGPWRPMDARPGQPRIAARLMTSRTTLDEKNVSRRWRKQLCPYCKQPFLGRGGVVAYCSAQCAADAHKLATRLRRNAKRRSSVMREQ
jgi:hypothetical protein